MGAQHQHFAVAATVSAAEDGDKGVLAKNIVDILASTKLEDSSLKDVRRKLEKRLSLHAGALDAQKEKLKILIEAEVARIQADRSQPQTCGNG